MIALAEKVVAAAPRLHLEKAPAADPADRLTGNPAAADLTPAAAGIERRESPRLCADHWSALQGCDPWLTAEQLEAAQETVVGNAAFLAGEHAAQLADNGCPVCFLNARSPFEHAYDDLLDLAYRHVVGGAS
ncbi:MAG TPA: hypothetical protein VN738_05100 [Acidothermaceae bacterium]|nr:hypothetical protein [Acidothermaceae bacterium]